MRVLILHRESPFPPDNGGRLRAAHLAQYLARHHDVALACFAAAGRRNESPERNLFRDFTALPLPPAAGRRRYFSNLPAEVLDTASTAMSDHVQRQVRDFAPDVIVAGEPSLSAYLEPYPHCVRVLDYLMVLTLSLRRLRAIAPWTKRWLWSARWRKQVAYHRRVAPLYDLCLVNSREDEEALLQEGAGWRQIVFLPNGLHAADYPLGLASPNPKLVVYPGSVTYEPNRDAVAWFIEQILPRVRADVPDVELLVTGAVPANGSAPQGTGVRYSGYVEDVRPLIAGAWTCVVPLRSGAGGTRFKVLEAMALGTPVISTTIGAEGVDGRDGQQLLIADDAHTFAVKTVELLRDVERRQRLAAEGRRLIDEVYNWERLGARVARLFAERIPGSIAKRGDE